MLVHACVLALSAQRTCYGASNRSLGSKLLLA